MSDSASITLPAARPLRVVIVCLGNICRSPMAKIVFSRALAKAGLAEAVEVDSAGTGSWHIGAGADERAVATLRRHGYDTAHTARQLTRDDLAESDLILVADRSNLADVTELARTPAEATKIRMLRSFDPAAGDDAEVPDPYYGDGDGFAAVLEMIEAAADGFVAEVASARTATG